MRQSGVAVASEVALADLAVLGPVKKRTPLLELVNAFGCFLGMELGHAPMVEELSTPHRVSKMDLPVVFGPDIAECRRDTALGHDGVSLAEQATADERGVGPSVLSGYRGPQAGPACPDHYDVIGLVFESFF